MKRLIIIGVCFLSLYLNGCTSSGEDNVKVTGILHHEPIEVKDMIVGYPGGIQKLDGELIIMDYTADSMFHRIDIQHQAYLGAFGVKGQGPDEFIHPTALHPYGNHALCGYDSGKREIKVLKKDSLSNRLTCSTLFKTSRLMAFDVIPYSSDKFVANGCFSDSAFCLLDNHQEYLDVSGSYPIKDEKEASFSCMTRAMAYQGILRLTPNGRMAFVTAHAKALYLYEIKDDKLLPLKRIIESYNEYTPDDSGGSGTYSVIHKGDLPTCFRDLSVTDNRIYALYSGRSFKDYRQASDECAYIYIYDWEGNRKEIYQLDIPVRCFYVDEQEHVVYAIANNPDPTLVRFALPA